MGLKVDAEFRTRLEELGESKNPKTQSTGKPSKTTREYQPTEDWEAQEVWAQAVGRVVDDVVVFFEDGRRSPDNPDPLEGLAYIKGKPIRWRTEKPITGNAAIDRSPGKGARTKFDELGRKRLEYDTNGKLIYRWAPPEQ